MLEADRAKLLKILNKIYPDPRSELDFKDPYQLLAAVILSAQCTDKKVNQVTPFLFAKFKNFRELSAARVSDIEKIIRPINYYRTKAKSLKGMAQMIISDFHGEIPRTRAEITSLPGVGQKTSNVVLGELGYEKTLPVDTHVFRVSKRLGLASGNTPHAVEEEIKALFKPETWRNLHHWLIFHGRRICKAQRPLCRECAIADLCPSRQDLGDT